MGHLLRDTHALQTIAEHGAAAEPVVLTVDKQTVAAKRVHAKSDTVVVVSCTPPLPGSMAGVLSDLCLHPASG